MRIISAKATNFASYKELAFDFTKAGLTLIQGPTGSGKSTLCDLIPWVLFGKTSKGGSVSEVLSWPGNEVTKVTLYLENVNIVRSRGPKSGDNDLYWQQDGVIFRGKDLNDTQKLINSLLGIDCDLYLAGSYFHEFSQTAQFFTTTAKHRRTICEQIVDLSLAKNLQLKATEETKQVSKFEQDFKNKIDKLESNIILLNKIQSDENNRADRWEVNREIQIKSATRYYDEFELNRKKIVSNKCRSCGTTLSEHKEVVDTSENPYIKQLADLELQVNPHTNSAKDYSDELETKHKQITGYKAELEFYINQKNDLELLQDVVVAYRSTTIQNAIQDVEYQTNQLLTNHFDGECQISFVVESTDKLEVTISKDGNTCSYTQLSKGQRQLLKLCFGVAIMRAVSNYSGVSFKQVWFDEGLDGLDEQMKLKAFGLLQTLSQEYESIFVVEHSEALKPMFLSSYSVRLVNGSSEIEKS